MTSWQLIKSPKLSGSANMRIDLKLFHDFEKGLIPSTLRIYSWRPKCISLGYSQEIDKLIDREIARELGWDVVKRPTGGGIVFHNEAEVTYSLVTTIDDPLLPKGLVPSYKRISEAVMLGLSKIGIVAQIRNPESEIRNKSKILNSESKTQLCFSYPAEYEIVVDGKKIVGSAQKRGRRALLQQGSIFVSNNHGDMSKILRCYEANDSAISLSEILGRIPSFEELSNALIQGFEGRLGIKLKT